MLTHQTDLKAAPAGNHMELLPQLLLLALTLLMQAAGLRTKHLCLLGVAVAAAAAAAAVGWFLKSFQG